MASCEYKPRTTHEPFNLRGSAVLCEVRLLDKVEVVANRVLEKTMLKSSHVPKAGAGIADLWRLSARAAGPAPSLAVHPANAGSLPPRVPPCLSCKFKIKNLVWQLQTSIWPLGKWKALSNGSDADTLGFLVRKPPRRKKLQYILCLSKTVKLHSSD